MDDTTTDSMDRGSRTRRQRLVLVALAVAAGLLVVTGAFALGRSAKSTVAAPARVATTLPPTTSTSTTTTTTTTTEPPTTTVPPPPTTVVVVVTTPPPPPTTRPIPITRTISGTQYLFDATPSVDGTWQDGQLCFGLGGYSDIGAGTQVTLRNEGGVVIGTTTLGPGTVQPWPEVAPQAKRCVFQFQFASVPDANFYSFEISHRGQVQQSRDELSAAGWHIDLHLG